MIAIETYYLPPTQTKPKRVVARAPGGQRVLRSAWTLPDDNEAAQRAVAEHLATRYGWLKGYKLVGGGYNDRMYWVFVEENAE